MPIIKLSLSDSEYQELQALAKAEGMSIQDLIRCRLLAKKNPPMFTPEEAERRALAKFTREDGLFTMPDVYGEDWGQLESRMTGTFGTQFNHHVLETGTIRCMGKTPDGRRTLYQVV